MFKYILALIFLIHFIGLNAQSRNKYADEYLDSIVEKIGPCKKKTLQEIAFLLKIKEPDELLQYSIISKWVVNNFYYLKSASGKPLKSAMQNRTIVCMHYAMIVDSLSKYCGLETEYISGYVKSETGLDPMGLHAWNSVKINGKIYLSDITWSDFEVGKRNKETDIMSRLYFLMEPEKFILTHYPANKLQKYTHYKWRRFKKTPVYKRGIYRFYNLSVHKENHFKLHQNHKRLEIVLAPDSLYKKLRITGVSMEIISANKKIDEKTEMEAVYEFTQLPVDKNGLHRFELILDKKWRKNKAGVLFIEYKDEDGSVIGVPLFRILLY